MGKVFYDKNINGLLRRVVDIDSKLVLLVESDIDKVKINFIFEYGPTTDESVAELCGYAEDLAINGRSGLLSLIYHANDNVEYKKKTLYKDGLVFGTEGNYSSELYVSNGELYYKIKSCCVGFWGEASFKFGDATKGRVDRINRIVTNFEDLFGGLVYTTKHNYIDNMDLYTEVEEEEA